MQLNRHIDDNHQELAEAEQDQVKTWFDKQILKAKRIQPLSLLNQKLRGLDVFESNESNPVLPPAAPGKPPVDGSVDPDDLITRQHWQRSTGYDVCTDPACGKGLGPINGNINCRHCGKLFCEAHTMYQMKLSRSASHEPVRGYWSRVCETCYKSREGYNDHAGVSVDHIDMFAQSRRKKVERHKLEVSRLEKRLTKLTKLLANPPERLAAANGSILSPVSSLTGQKHPRKLIEQSVVTWEDDEAISSCPFCQQDFGSWTFRRHHCRICGRVVCADPQTACSTEVSLNIASGAYCCEPPLPEVIEHVLTMQLAGPNSAAEKPVANVGPGGQLSVDIRMCRDCNHTIFSGRDFEAALARKPPDQKAYETLRQFERGIQQLMPSFHRILLALQPESRETGGHDHHAPPPSLSQIEEARKIRRRLLDSFNKYNDAARRIRDMKTDSEMQKKLQKAIYMYASGFLHTNMLPLKSLPQMLRSRTSASSSSSRLTGTANHHSSSGLRHTELAAASETSSQTSRDAGGDGASTPNGKAASEASTIVSQLETEERQVRERLAVLEEQRFMVSDMVRSARDARRFEEVTALSRNLDELDGEIAVAKKSIGLVEERWEGVYRNGGGGGA